AWVWALAVIGLFGFLIHLALISDLSLLQQYLWNFRLTSVLLALALLCTSGWTWIHAPARQAKLQSPKTDIPSSKHISMLLALILAFNIASLIQYKSTKAWSEGKTNALVMIQKMKSSCEFIPH